MFALAQKEVARLNTWAEGNFFANLTPDLYQVSFGVTWQARNPCSVTEPGGKRPHGPLFRFDLYVF
jgi:hypothetical protein